MLMHFNKCDRTILITPIGGIGNRLMAIFTTIAYCIIEDYSKLIIRWTTNPHCNIHIDKIIKITNIDHDILEYDQYHHDRKNRIKPIHPNLYGYNCVNETSPGIRTSLSSDGILQWIINNISNYVHFVKYEPFVEVAFGLHCRRSDWGVTTNCIDIVEDLYSKRRLLDVEFSKFIGPIIKDTPAFLSTDSINTEEYFKSVHPNIIVKRKIKYPIGTERDATMTLEALIDLHTLAAADTIIRDSESSFSLIAAIIGKRIQKPNGFITWTRPVLHASGPGLSTERA